MLQQTASTARGDSFTRTGDSVRPALDTTAPRDGWLDDKRGGSQVRCRHRLLLLLLLLLLKHHYAR